MGKSQSKDKKTKGKTNEPLSNGSTPPQSPKVNHPVTTSNSSSTHSTKDNAHVDHSSTKHPPNGTSPSSNHQNHTNPTNNNNNGDDDDFDSSEEEPTIFSKNKQTVTKDDFELLTVIGKGSFGKVMQVRKIDDGKIYAMKVLRKDTIIARKQVTHTKAEKNILQKIQHPFIVGLNYAFQTKDKLYMILDYINGGELFFHLKKEGRFGEDRVRLYAAEIVTALDHLHSLDIVYRDLKPENILLDSEGHVTITDFGLSKKIENPDGTHTFCGTPEYLAPEVLRGQGHGTAVDWWSLGTLVYEMLTGLPPFYAQNVNVMYNKILSGELRFPAYLSPEAKSMLEGLLTRDPEKRLGFHSGAEVKAHPWFAAIDWDKLMKKEIEPVFKPKVKNTTDTSQIDPQFTRERPTDSLVEAAPISESMQNNFDGFTFVAETVLGQSPATPPHGSPSTPT